MIAGVVLAGGQSSRYGEPKMFAMYNGQPLYMQSVQALSVQAISKRIIVTNAILRPQFQLDEVDYVIEVRPHEGPLVALQKVMQHYPQVEWFFVLACDMPLMDNEFVETLLAALDPAVEVIMPIQNDQIQPLASLYHRRLLPTIDEAVAAQKRSMKAIISEANVKFVPFKQELQYFLNINRQQDWPKERKDD